MIHYNRIVLAITCQYFLCFISNALDKKYLLSYHQKMAAGVFSVLPANFFSPLSTINREHYTALLVLYYRLFQENTRGLERELVIREFMNYLSLHHDTLSEESGDDDFQSLHIAEDIPPAQEFNFADEHPAEKISNPRIDERVFANRFLRRLINAGWLGEETLADFSRVINITAWGKPFMKKLMMCLLKIRCGQRIMLFPI
jgi:hypothetical protein